MKQSQGNTHQSVHQGDGQRPGSPELQPKLQGEMGALLTQLWNLERQRWCLQLGSVTWVLAC